MNVIIPMTGYGSRFVAAGFKELKPFIKVGGKPIINWIVEGMYSSDSKYLFVCRKDHLDKDAEMKDRLMDIAENTEIFAIEDWIKKGPVYDVLRAAEKIPDDEPCIINYCDFYMIWDYLAFIKEADKRGCEGAVPCYTGFHPHLLKEKNLYASCRVDDAQNMLEIREKYSFEKDKTKSLHSPGVYYFKTGALLKKYCQLLVDNGPDINGEYYASLPYNYMVKDGLKVWVPANVEYFCQWGTPEDMKEYNFWIDLVKEG